MIFSGIKLGIANKKLAPLLRNRSVSNAGDPVRSIGLLLDSETLHSAETFRRFQERLGVKDADFSVITCLEAKPKSEFEGGAFCSPGDLNWKGKFARKEVQEFMEREFDLLVCFIGKDTALTRLMERGVKAGFKISRSEDPQPEGAADISIAVPVEESDLFLKEVEKYLKIFNKLK